MLKNIFKIIFPNECLGCELMGDFICIKCLNAIPVKENVNCLFCGHEVILGKVCNDCSLEVYLERVISAANYNDLLVSRLIQECKYKRVKEVSSALSKILIKHLDNNHLIESLKLSKARVTFIPLHIKRYDERGFNQSEEIAKFFARKYDLEFCSLLVRDHWKGIQKDSTKEERQENISGAFEFCGDFVPEVVILIDDVVTTGSTLNEAAKVLKVAGVERVIGLTVAHE